MISTYIKRCRNQLFQWASRQVESSCCINDDLSLVFSTKSLISRILTHLFSSVKWKGNTSCISRLNATEHKGLFSKQPVKAGVQMQDGQYVPRILCCSPHSLSQSSMNMKMWRKGNTVSTAEWLYSPVKLIGIDSSCSFYWNKCQKMLQWELGPTHELR